VESLLAATEYSWIKPYHAALFEMSSVKILDQITRAEEAIHKRRMELLELSQTGDEVNAIEQALKALSQLREITQRHG
jgi:hypothetical protein